VQVLSSIRISRQASPSFVALIEPLYGHALAALAVRRGNVDFGKNLGERLVGGDSDDDGSSYNSPFNDFLDDVRDRERGKDERGARIPMR
jgi:hypothetical protein